MSNGILADIYERVLDESIHDKYLFKSCFMAGGGGSGKTFLSELMFAGLPIQFVNSDLLFQRLMKKSDLPFTIDSSNKEIYVKQMSKREAAKRMTKSRFLHWINGMLPLVIDGTGKNYDKIQSQSELLGYVGYDTSMVFVNTSLEVSLQRNRERERKVPEEVVTQAWHDAQGNIGKFQSLFGDTNFLVIDNNTFLDKAGIKQLEVELTRKAMKFLNTPLQNKIGVAVLKELDRIGGLYLSDLTEVESGISRARSIRV
jgi:predicted kinase